MGECQPEKCRKCPVKETCPILSFVGDDEQGFLYFNHLKLKEIFHGMLVDYQSDGLPEKLFLETMSQMTQFILDQKKYYDGTYTTKERR